MLKKVTSNVISIFLLNRRSEVPPPVDLDAMLREALSLLYDVGLGGAHRNTGNTHGHPGHPDPTG